MNQRPGSKGYHARFFIPPEWLNKDELTITGPLVYQIKNVLRLIKGDHIIVLDNSGWEHEVEISSISKEKITGRVAGKTLVTSEPRTKITLYQALLKGKSFEFVLQKGTELGIVEFVPILSDRCVVAGLGNIGDNKFDRWQRIILEAAEQSRRGRLPNLCPVMLFEQVCDQAGRRGLSLIPWEEERKTSLRSALRKPEQPPFSINLLIGPEGGFTLDEVERARSYGVISVTLGPRLLRAETAGLVATTVILYELGDLE